MAGVRKRYARPHALGNARVPCKPLEPLRLKILLGNVCFAFVTGNKKTLTLS